MIIGIRLVGILDTFRKFTSIRNTIGSGLKGVATGSVSKKYETNLFAQFSKTFFENLKFDIICPIFNIQQAPSKIIRYGVHLPKENVSSYFVGYNDVNIQQQQLNLMSRRIIFEETS